MKVSAVLVAVLLFCPGIVAEGRALGVSQVAEAVQQKYASLKGLSADFRQESRVATLGRVRRKSGTIHFLRGGRMRWEYRSPDSQLIVTDGRTLWYFRPDENQVVVQDIDLAFTSQTPLLFLFGEGDLAEEFTWKEEDLAADGSGLLTLELTPRRETPDLVALTLEVRSADYSIASTVLRDAFGNVTRLDFSGEKEDPALDESLFTFEIPDGAEVVRP